jgi:outer membrane receptor protein involved in Fe transport
MMISRRATNVSRLGRHAVIGAALSGLCLPAMARAEDAPTEADIIVTANRYEQALADVPLSLYAADRDRLDRDRIENIDDLARTVPGLSLRGAWGGTSKIAIRGIASNVGAATTGIYIDDTPIQVRSLGAADIVANSYPEIFDLERIEVLRGPQGTLFGQGSEGGTVRFITPEPSLTESRIYGKASLATTEGGELSFLTGGAASAALAPDRLGVRVSAMVRRDGGWIERTAIGGTQDKGEDVNRREAMSLRGAALWAPAANIRLTPSVFYQRTTRDDTDQYWESLSDPDQGRYVSGQPLAQPSKDRFLLPALKAEVDFGSVTLLSNSSWFDRDAESSVDYSIHAVEGITRGALTLVPFVPDFTADSRFDVGQKVFAQEVRLQSGNADSPLNWTAGLFYSDSRQAVDQDVVSPRFGNFTQIVLGCPLLFCFGQDALPGGIVYTGSDRSRDKQYAAFGQADWRVVEALRVTLGARVTRNQNRFENSQNGPLNFGPSASAGTTSNTVVTPRVGLAFEPSPDVLLYTSAAKGARPGGGNPAVPAAFCAADLAALGFAQVPGTYGADHVWTYEAGAKGRAGRQLSYQLSAFHTDWRNIQQSVALPNCGFAYVANLGRAASRGFDAEFEFRPIEQFRLGASAAYTHAEYRETLSTAAGTRLISDGDRLPVPPWQARLSAAYDFALGAREASLQLDYEYASGYRRVPSAPAFLYDPLNPRAGSIEFVSGQARIGGGAWEASLFVENLLNSKDAVFRTHDSPFAPTFRRQGLRPRTIGVQFIVKR